MKSTTETKNDEIKQRRSQPWKIQSRKNYLSEGYYIESYLEERAEGEVFGDQQIELPLPSINLHMYIKNLLLIEI